MSRLSERARAIEPTLIRRVTDAARPTSLNLGLGQPDLGLSDEVVTALHAFADDAAAPYSPNAGTAACRQAVAQRYGVEPENVLVTCGAQEALAVALLGVVNAGEEVLVPDPGFPAYPNLIRAAGATPVAYPLDANWQLEPERVADLVTERTAAVVVNNPGNPTGAVLERAALDELVALCHLRGIEIISDEIYEDFVFVGSHTSARELGDGRAITISGLSKSHAMMGLRLGWLIADPATVSGLTPLHQHLVTSAPTISQAAAIAALGGMQERLALNREVFAARRELFMDAVASMPGVELRGAQGAFYGFVDVRSHLADGRTSVELAMDILGAVDVVTIPGDGFGARGAGHLRLAYTVSEAILVDAVQRLGEYFAARRNQ